MDLKRLEAGLRKLVESQVLRAVPGHKPEDRLAQRLTESMEAGAQIDSEGNRIAPNVFTLLIHPDSVARWRDAQLLKSVIQVLNGEAEASGLRSAAAPSIALAPDAAIPLGEFRVVASH